MQATASIAEQGHLDAVVQSGVMQAALEGIVTFDERLRIEWANPSAQRMFDREARQLLGHPLSELIADGSKDAVSTFLRPRSRANDPDVERPEKVRLVGLRAGGEVFPLEASIFQVDGHGELLRKRRYAALLWDLSRQEALSDLVDQLNRRMRNLFDLLPVAIWVADDDRVVYANRACANLLGVPTCDGMAGRSIYGFLDPSIHDVVREAVQTVLETQTSALPVSGLVAGSDGTPRAIELLVAALPDRSRTLVQMVLSDASPRAREDRTLSGAPSTLRDLAAGLVDAREEERRRIARELHDELGQRLTALKLELSAIDPSNASGLPGERWQALIEMVDDTVAATRRLSTDLRPAMLDDLGLTATIEWLTREFERRSSLKIELQLDLVPERLPPGVLTALYRIVQEALTNIVRHSQAHRAWVAITRTASGVDLRVEDDGRGLPDQFRQSARGSLGLIGIHERVQMLGGHLRLGERVGGGLSLVIQIPLSGDRDAAPAIDAEAHPGIAP